MEEKEIEVNGEKIKIAIKLSKDEIEDNNTKRYLLIKSRTTNK